MKKLLKISMASLAVFTLTACSSSMGDLSKKLSSTAEKKSNEKVVKKVVDSKEVDKNSSDDKIKTTVSKYCKQAIEKATSNVKMQKSANDKCVEYVVPKVKEKLGKK